MNPLDTTTRAEREERDQRIYDQVRGDPYPGWRPRPDPDGARESTLKRALAGNPPCNPATLHDAEEGRRIGAPIGTDRARELAAKSNQADRRPAITSARVRQLSALAELVRPRAKARSELYGLPRHQADDIRRAIAFIDDLALWERRHR